MTVTGAVPIGGVQAVDPLALAPAVATLVALVVVLLADAVAPAGRRVRRVHDVVALTGLTVSGLFVALLAVAATGRDVGPVAGAASVCGPPCAPRAATSSSGRARSSCHRSP